MALPVVIRSGKIKQCRQVMELPGCEREEVVQ
jgi:hypothetical protein